MSRIGLIFLTDDESGIALVNVIDTVTGLNLVTDSYIDLYQKNKDATNLDYATFIFWVTLPYSDEGRYTWTVEHSGMHNPQCGGSDYFIQFNGYLYEYDELYPANISKRLTYYHTDYPETIYTKVITGDVVDELTQVISLSGDDLTETFDPTTTIQAKEFLEYSVNSGATWTPVYEGDYSITWGSNAPHYNDNIILLGKFNVSFIEAPPTGTDNVQFKIVPMYNTITCSHILTQPQDVDNFVNYEAENKLLHYSLELIP